MASNDDMAQRRSDAVPRGVASAVGAFIDRAENGEIWDLDGNHYVDFASGIAVLNVGHRHRRVMEAARAQMERFTHAAFQVLAYDVYVELAERLNALAPIEGEVKTIFFTTGAEAVENAVKIARAATERPGVIAFVGGFHGRTQLAGSMTGKVHPYRSAYAPQSSHVYHAPFPGEHTGSAVEDTLRALSFIFKADIPPERVAAIILEPVQGEGGFHIAPPELLRELRRLCDAHGILLIADEIQTGFARTGKMFAIEHSGVCPDLVTMAKSLAGGFPLSAVAGRKDFMDMIAPGGLGGTYGGNPVACAAALAVLDVIEEEGLAARAVEIGKRITTRLRAFARQNGLAPIAGIRNFGAMAAFDVVTGRMDETPDPDAAKAIAARAASEGLVLLTCGSVGETIRILPALTMSDDVLDVGLDRLESALRTG